MNTAPPPLSSPPSPGATPAGSPSVPRAAQRLGWAGLLPFIGGSLLVWGVSAEAHPYVTLALSAYAGTIVSFLGGIHWGLAFRLNPPPLRLLAWGVVPSLVAWVALVMPASAGLVVHGVMLLICYAVDRRVYPTVGAAHWLTLRFRLSSVAALSCFIGAAGT